MYLQDPQNGANPIMARLKPILEANIQEHSVLKYQEQMNGMARATMEQLPPDQQQNPQVAEMAMATAAQQVLNANQMGQAQSPEQQMVALETAKVELEKQKLQSTMAKFSADSALDAQKLELEEAKLMVAAGKSGQDAVLKKEKADLDRASKETMKSLDLLAKTTMAEEKNAIDMEKIRIAALTKVASMDDLDDRQRSFKLIDVMMDLLKEEMKGDDQNANRE